MTGMTREKPGIYKEKLNNYEQSGRIRSYAWLEDQKHERNRFQTGFTSCVEVELIDGKKIQYTSPNICTSKKESKDAAAKNAISELDKILPTHHSVPGRTEGLIYKQKLNNIMHGRFHTQLPGYETIPVGEQQFQCTVTHSKFGKVTGNVCHSKKEAEDDAARQALDNLLK